MREQKVAKKGVVVEISIKGKIRRLKQPLHVDVGDVLEIDDVTGVVYKDGTPFLTEPADEKGGDVR